MEQGREGKEAESVQQEGETRTRLSLTEVNRHRNTPKTFKKIKSDVSLSCHMRLGHMSHRYMKHMVQHKLAHGVPLSIVQELSCGDCHRGKMTQNPYRKMVQKALVKE